MEKSYICITNLWFWFKILKHVFMWVLFLLSKILYLSWVWKTLKDFDGQKKNGWNLLMPTKELWEFWSARKSPDLQKGTFILDTTSYEYILYFPSLLEVMDDPSLDKQVLYSMFKVLPSLTDFRLTQIFWKFFCLSFEWSLGRNLCLSLF